MSCFCWFPQSNAWFHNLKKLFIKQLSFFIKINNLKNIFSTCKINYKREKSQGIEIRTHTRYMAWLAEWLSDTLLGCVLFFFFGASGENHQNDEFRPRWKRGRLVWSHLGPVRHEWLYRIVPRIINTHKPYHDDNVGNSVLTLIRQC